MGKAKPAKHTSAEIKSKITAATQNKGGGAAGMKDRQGGVGHAKYKCPICAQQAPDLKSMQVHFCWVLVAFLKVPYKEGLLEPCGR